MTPYRQFGTYAERPKRKMPTLLAIVRHLGLADEHPFCWKCGLETDAERWARANSELERAHVIDRVFDGLDNEANLRPLCSLCHMNQPNFKAGEEEQALAWFNKRGNALLQRVDLIMQEIRAKSLAYCEL